MSDRDGEPGLDDAATLLREARQVALACHVNPDGDALGSMLGLLHVLRAAGYDVVASFPTPFRVAPHYRHLPGLELLTPPSEFPSEPDTGQLLFIDPAGTTLTTGQNVVDLITAGTINVLFDGGQIQQGSVVPDTSQGGQIGVSFTLSPEAQAIWCDYTTAHVGQPGPIALDGEIITTPTIQSAICGGRTIITVGAGTEATVEQTTLYNQLRFGALPVSLRVQEVTAIQPTLGQDFLNQALIAGIVGLALVLFFMIANYRLPGVLASLALIFYTLVVYAIFRIIPVTLTLAGVAAFILSIGMAVDANILIFERMKEEIRAGKTLGPAIEAGFNRAWSSILDSNVSSLLIAGWLFWQGTSVIRGFALVLAIGVLVSMFSAVVVTRTLLRMVIHREWGRRIELYHVER